MSLAEAEPMCRQLLTEEVLTQVIYHDAFQSPSFWNGAFNYPQTSDVMLDQ